MNRLFGRKKKEAEEPPVSLEETGKNMQVRRPSAQRAPPARRLVAAGTGETATWRPYLGRIVEKTRPGLPYIARHCHTPGPLSQLVTLTPFHFRQPSLLSRRRDG